MKRKIRAAAWLLVLALALCACSAPQEPQIPEVQTEAAPEHEPEKKPEVQAPPASPEAEKPAESEAEETAPPAPEAEPEESELEETKPEPVPEETEPEPEPQPEAEPPAEPAQPTVTVSVRCDTILANLDALDSAKHGLVPADGVILAETVLTFTEGENAFDLLQRAARESKIHLEHSTTPMYKTAYIEGIGNLYEFDCGPLSGWMYRVNGQFPNYGCSKYAVCDGDVLEWLYTCDLGGDVGGADAFENQRQ